MAALQRKRPQLATRNPQAKRRPSSPVTSGRVTVRGLRRSKRRSAIRLKTMAALRAPTIAPRIQPVCLQAGTPRAARIAPVKANGSANRVCWNLIIERVAATARRPPAPARAGPPAAPGAGGLGVDAQALGAAAPALSEAFPIAS